MQVNAKLFHPSGIVALATNSGSPSPRKSIQKRSEGGILSQKRSRAGYTYSTTPILRARFLEGFFVGMARLER